MNDQNTFGKNYFAAILLSALVMIAYFMLVKPAQPQKPTAPAETIKTEVVAAETKTEVLPAAVSKSDLAVMKPADLIKLESNEISAEFSNAGGTVNELKFKGEPGRETLTQTSFYSGDIEQPGIFSVAFRGQAEHLARSVFKRDTQNKTGISYVYEEPGAFRLTKTYRFVADSPALELNVEVKNLSSREQVYPIDFRYAYDYDAQQHANPGEYFSVLAFTNGLKSADAHKIEKKGFWLSEPTAWTALVKRYFALIVRPDKKIIETRAEAKEEKIYVTTSLEPVSVAASASTNVHFKIYAGPQRYETLKKFEDGLEAVLSRGFFGLFKIWLLQTLKFLDRITHNYGWAIILLTFLIKTIFFPLTVISSKSMKKMQALSPKQKAIQEKYKNDPPRAQKEIMELYKRNKVNPLSGCLPMLIQLPILIGMFRLLPEAIELHGAPFMFWIRDLSAPDHFMQLPFKIPFLGEWLNVLPIFMIVSQVGYQQLMPQMSAQPEQKMIMNIMPFFFGFISWAFPSGLVLYWIFQNIFSMMQQLWINRIQTDIHPDDRG